MSNVSVNPVLYRSHLVLPVEQPDSIIPPLLLHPTQCLSRPELTALSALVGPAGLHYLVNDLMYELGVHAIVASIKAEVSGAAGKKEQRLGVKQNNDYQRHTITIL